MARLYPLLVLLALTLLAFPVVAQTEPSAVGSGAQYLTSISGIIVLTIGLVSVLVRLLAPVPGIKHVPVWLMAVAVSVGLTALAHYVFGTLAGDPLDLFIRAVEMAAAASGFREWIQRIDVTPEMKAKATKLGGLVLACALFTGCVASPAERAFVASMDQYHQTVGASWEAYINADPDLSAEERERRLNTHDLAGQNIQARQQHLNSSPGLLSN